MTRNFFSRITQALASLAAAIVIAASTPVTAQDASNPYAFEKKAVNADGTPYVGPPNVGDTIKYVLTYKPGATNSGPVTIDDQLSPNLSYVGPTTSSPGWTWGSSPYVTGNKETYSNPGFGPGTGSIDLPVTGLPAPSPGAGDGTIPIPILSLNKVFGVFHHATSPAVGKIDCWDLTTLAKCGVPQSNAVSGWLGTPDTPHSIVRGTKFYFPGRNSAGAPTIGCFDASANSACADTPLSASVSSYKQLAGLVEDGAGRVYMAANDKLFCNVLSGTTWSTCPGWAATGLTTMVPAPAPNSMYMIPEFGPSPTRAYIHLGSGKIQCIDFASQAPCSGWGITGKSVPNAFILSSIPGSGSSSDGGVCAWVTTTLQGCLSSSGASLTGTPTGPLAGASFYSAYRLPGTARVYFPNFPGGTGPLCFDYSGATGTACAGYTPQAPSSAQQYGFAVDPSKPEKCMLSLGHNNFMWRFDYNTGQIGCGTESFTTPAIESLFCSGKPDPTKFSWTGFAVPTAGAAGTLLIKQGGTTVYTGAVTSIFTAFTTPPTGAAPLTVTFTPSSGSPIQIVVKLIYNSDRNADICYSATVKSCGVVSNTATMKGAFNNAPFSVVKTVDFGKAKGPQCDPVDPPVDTASCFTSDPKVTCGPTPGTYVVTLNANTGNGVAPTEVELAVLTPGVTIVNPKDVYKPNANGQIQLTVTGATPGTSIEFDVSGSRPDQASKDGMSICCVGKIKITIPKDINCDPKQLVDLAIKKTGGTTPAPNVGAYSFTLNMTNEGNGFTPAAGTLVIKDVVPPGMTFTTVTPSAGWACSPATPIVAGGTLTCTYTGGALGAGPANTIGSIKIDATANGSAPFPPFKNCADIGLTSTNPAESKLSNNKSCVTVSKQPDLKIVKTGPESCKPNAPCAFTVSITSIGQPYSGPVMLADAVSPNNWSVASITPNICGASVSSTPFACVANLNLAADTAFSFSVVLNAPGSGPLQNENCISMAIPRPGANVQPNKIYTAAELQPLIAAGQFSSPKESCWKFKSDKDDPPQSDLKVVKTCQPAQEIIGAVNRFEAKCKITVTTTGPQSGTIAVNDTINGMSGVTVTSMASSTTPAWSCTVPNCSINGSNLNQTASTSVIDVVVKFPTQGHAMESQNCATATSPANSNGVKSCTPFTVDGSKASVSVKKTVKFNGAPIAMNGNFAISASCDNSVTSIAAGQTITIGNLAAGTACTITETNTGDATANGFANEICKGQKFSWNTSYAPANQTANAGAGALVEIINELRCDVKQDGQLVIKKVVVNNAPGSVAGLVFNIIDTCPGSTQNPGFVAFKDGETYAFKNYEAGINCTVSELRDADAAPYTGGRSNYEATKACGDLKPVWTTTYSPSQTVALSPQGNVVTVTNTLNCEKVEPVIYPFTVYKNVVNNAPGSVSGLVFPITSTCTPNTTNAHSPMNVGYVAGQGTIFGGALGDTCTVSEGAIPATDACGDLKPVWTTTYQPSATFTVGTNNPTITVTNTLDCEGTKAKGLTTFSVRKEATYDGGPITDISFPMEVSCGKGGVQSLNVMGGQSETIGNLPDGTTCTVAEGAIPKTGLCPTGTTEEWSTSYVPANAQNTTSTLSSVVVTVQNSLSCKSNVIIKDTPNCDPRTTKLIGNQCRCSVEGMVKVSATRCGCPDGQMVINGRCAVPPPNCDDRTAKLDGNRCVCTVRGMVPVSKTSCACPDGLKVVNGRCAPPPPRCDGETAQLQGDRCVCTVRGMVPVNKTSCACRKGERVINGRCQEPPPVCKEGTRANNRGQCVSICDRGARYNSARNRCEPVCPRGTRYDAGENRCERVQPVCQRGARYNPKRERCEPVCPRGTRYDVRDNRCEEVRIECPEGTRRVGRICVPFARCPRGQIALGPVCVDVRGRPDPVEDGPIERDPHGGIKLPGLD